jgi:alcohol dehydrogenase
MRIPGKERIQMYELMKTYSFRVPTRMDYGVGVAASVGEVARELESGKAFLVTDRGVVRAGLQGEVVASLESEGLEIEVYEKPEAEPDEKMVHEGATQLRDSRAKVIIALGGGGVMDTAKAIKGMVANEGSSDEAKEYKLPLVTIPTTAGTGSESNGAAVIIDSKRGVKTVIYNQHMTPNVALVDPLMTMTAPPRVTAYTGLDALAQAMGAYVANVSQPAADALAIYAVELIYSNLGRAVAKGDDLEARTNMMLGSMISGIAMLNSNCTGEHFLAETVGAHYGLAHGLTVAIFLPYVMEYNRLAAPDKFVRLARAMGEKVEGLTVRDGSRKAVEAVVELLKDLEIPTLKEVGVHEEELEELAEKTMSHVGIERKLNPREMTRDDVLKLYQKAYHGDFVG